MKTKIELTKDQIDLLVKIEQEQLRIKFEKDLSAIRKKYEFVVIDMKSVQAPAKQTKKSKLTDEQLRGYINEGLSMKEVSEISGFNLGYLYKRQKGILLAKN
jgi:hypothetical protein